MNYYELKFTYESPIEATIISDVLASELGEIGFESFTEDEDGLLAYVSDQLYNVKALQDKLNEFPLENVTIRYTEQLVESKDWNEEWEKNYFKPIRIGNDCIIRASFHEPEPGYILAKMKHANKVVGIDIDEWAYNNALENTRLNHTEDIQIALGGAEQIPAFGTFDIVFANINRNILLNDINQYVGCMKPGTTLFMSGFYTEDIPAIQAECERNGLKFISHAEKNNWVAVKTQKP